jgi:hypothetical protein
MEVLNMTAIAEAAVKYAALGWIVHPLHSPTDKCNSPGKQPVLNDWADRTEPVIDTKMYHNGRNVGVVSGHISKITVIDFDDMNFYDWLVADVDTSDFLLSSRTEGRCHAFFQFVPELKQRMSKKLKKGTEFMGIDILSDNKNGGGSNVVLPPSVHVSGDVYKFNREPTSVPEMPEKFKNKLLELIEDENELVICVKKCRKWVHDFFSNPDILHGGDGRRCMLALTAELRANGLSDRGVHFAAKVVYRQDYDKDRTARELSHIGKPWKSKTLIQEFPEYCNEANTGGGVPTPEQESTSTSNEDIDIEEALKDCEVPESTLKKSKAAKEFINNVFAGIVFDDLPVYNDFVLKDVKEHFGIDKQDSINKIWNTYTSGRREALRQFKEEQKQRSYNEEEQEEEKDIQFDEEHIPPEEIAKAKTEAIKVMKEGDPMRYMCDTIKGIHVGDEQAVEGLNIAISNQSCTNTQGIQVKLSGDSGGGKSHLAKSVCHCIRDKHIKESSLSAKAAYYMDLQPGTIMFSDDTEISEDMETVIKRATTNYQDYTQHTTVKDGAAMVLTIPPRILWLITSVEDNVSDQLLNRQLIFNVDTSEAQKQRIFEMQRREALEGEIKTLCINHEVLVCREMWDIIKNKEFKVKIPFAEDIDVIDKSNSRNFPMFLDMVKGYTVLNHMQRDVDEDGYLLATVDDFYKAKALFETQTENILTKLNEKEARILKAISDAGIIGADYNMIAAATGYTYPVVRNTIKGRPNRPGGLLEKVKGLQFFEETEGHTVEEEQGLKTTTNKKRDRFVLRDFNAWELYNTGFVFLKGDAKNIA